MSAGVGGHRQITLLASGARTVSGTSTYTGLDRYQSASIMLDVTAAATAVTDTLDVYLQRSPDGGTTWDDFVHFTQVLGNGGAVKHLAVWQSLIAPTRELGAPQDAAMAVDVLHGGPIGPKLRVKWVVVEVSAASFTFSVEAQFSC